MNLKELVNYLRTQANYFDSQPSRATEVVKVHVRNLRKWADAVEELTGAIPEKPKKSKAAPRTRNKRVNGEAHAHNPKQSGTAESTRSDTHHSDDTEVKDSWD